MKKTIFLIFLISFVQTAVVEAQSFIQSRYSGQPTVPECAGCDADFDGITHIRFDPASTALSSDDEGRNFITVKFQIRRQVFQTDTPIYISAAGFRLAYDTDVYGTSLADPVVPADDFSGDPRPQCSFDRSTYFTDPQAFGVQVYALRFLDSTPEQLNINEAHSQQAVAGVPPAAGFVALGEDWQDHITLTCEIPSGENNNDAGFAISGAQPRGIFFRNYPTGSPPAQVSTAVLLADNDLRGFRLDGKTWAKDYSRYGNGEGVRLEFSKGIRDALAIGNFTLDSTGDSSLISTVNHTPNSPIVEIEFSQAIENDILRLSTDTAVVDEDGGNLADGNFLAQLFYDADAPQATGIRRDSAFTTNTPNQSRWFLDFSHAITTPTVAGLCVTEDNGTCVAEGERASVNVVRVDVVTTSTIAIVTQGMSAANRSIEFRRNAVLGADDYKVVEDYQPELRGVLPESVPPTISVRWVDMNGDPIDNPRSAELDPPDTAAGTYTMFFRVTASEPVANLNDPTSYNIATIDDLGSPSLEDYSTARISALPGSSTTRTLLQFTSEAASEVSDDGIEAFVLRASASFQDSVGNAAVRADDSSRINTGQPIDLRYNRAAAKRDDDSPILTQEPSRLDLTGSEYSLTFNISANEDVPTLSDAGSYQLVVENRDDVVVDPSAFTVASSNASGSSTQAVITYTVRFSDVAAASTAAAFILNRAAGQLLDRSFNQPVNDEGAAIANGEEVARVVTDDVSPQITGVSPVSIAPATGSDAYDITLDITANEPIRVPDGAIFPIIVNASDRLTSGFRLISSTNRDSDNSVRYVFRITPPSDPAAREAIRGYTLVTVQGAATRITDIAGNVAVRPDDSALYTEDTNQTVRFDNSQIQPIPRPDDDDYDLPTLNVVAAGTATETDNLIYSGSFTVSGPSDLYITNINTTASYRLLRVPFANSAPGTPEPISSGAISVGPVSDNSDQVVLNFSGATLADIAQAQATFGFTIGLNPDASSSDRLHDPYGNLLDLADGINNNEADARAPIERVITVEADEATPSEDNPNEYMGSFTVTVDVPVQTLDTSSSYTLLRINDDDTESLVPAEQVVITTTPTQLSNQVTVSFATSQSEITITRATQGFTLGVVPGALENDLGTLPRAIDGRLDPRDAAVAARDTNGPQLTVVASPADEAEDTSEEDGIINYNMSFVVSADEPVRDIDSTASYILLIEPSTTTDIPFTVTMTALPAGADEATVNVDVSIDAIYEDAVEGFTLGYNIATATELTLNDLAGNPPVNMSGDALADGDRLDESDEAVASTNPVMIECADFYPNIGQRQLFFRVTSMSQNLGSITLMGDTSPLSVEQLGPRNNETGVSILRATLDSEITDSMSMLVVSYQPAEESEDPVIGICIESLLDTDEDGIIDVADNNPFDPNDTTLNANTGASSEQLVNTPSELPNYYNRDVIIPSLLEGEDFESFTYVIANDGSTPTQSTFDNGISNDDYLGINMSENTKFFKISGSDCEPILRAAYANRLGNVKLDEFCEGINDEIDFTTAEIGSDEYAWVDIGENNRLQISSTNMPIIYTLKVLPEINFAGQSSYLFPSPTNRNVTVSADVGNTMMSLTSNDGLGVRTFSYNTGYSDRRSEDNLALSGSAIISTSYNIASPEPGETILYWLEGSSNVWSLTNALLLSPRSGGHRNFDDASYAIGGNNNIAVRVAGIGRVGGTGNDEPITRLRQILLYEDSDTELTRVSFMVEGETYVVVADIDTNVPPIQIDAEFAEPMMAGAGYEIDESTSNRVALMERLREEDGLENSNLAFIRLMVMEDDNVMDRRLVTVGWDRMAGITGSITADYLVLKMPSDAYRAANTDTDRDDVPTIIESNNMEIPIDSYPTSSTRLQVTINGNTGGVHYVQSSQDNSMDGGQLDNCRCLSPLSDLKLQLLQRIAWCLVLIIILQQTSNMKI